MTRAQNPQTRMIVALILGVTIYGLAMGTTYPLLGLLLSDRVSGALIGINTAATGLGLMTGVVLLPGLGRRLGAVRRRWQVWGCWRRRSLRWPSCATSGPSSRRVWFWAAVRVSYS
ncbi:hypothetical protein [Mesorhizobium sp.]|uniref:hypothetical protein n=1 Tax=Mesorhizobium sp. TaxID=1871066 RepID=UPI0025FC5599|nr:hypothetical protein [Mesorhizobium sp.]